MLVLSRSKNQKINFYVTKPDGTTENVLSMVMLKVDGDRARLGFNADKSLIIVREEVDDLCKS